MDWLMQHFFTGFYVTLPIAIAIVAFFVARERADRSSTFADDRFSPYVMGSLLALFTAIVWPVTLVIGAVALLIAGAVHGPQILRARVSDWRAARMERRELAERQARLERESRPVTRGSYR